MVNPLVSSCRRKRKRSHPTTLDSTSLHVRQTDHRLLHPKRSTPFSSPTQYSLQSWNTPHLAIHQRYSHKMGRLATHIAASFADADNLPSKQLLPKVSFIDALLPRRCVDMCSPQKEKEQKVSYCVVASSPSLVSDVGGVMAWVWVTCTACSSSPSPPCELCALVFTFYLRLHWTATTPSATTLQPSPTTTIDQRATVP